MKSWPRIRAKLVDQICAEVRNFARLHRHSSFGQILQVTIRVPEFRTQIEIFEYDRRLPALKQLPCQCHVWPERIQLRRTRSPPSPQNTVPRFLQIALGKC